MEYFEIGQATCLKMGVCNPVLVSLLAVEVLSMLTSTMYINIYVLVITNTYEECYTWTLIPNSLQTRCCHTALL